MFGECMVELVAKQGDTLHKGFAGDTYNTAIYMHRCAANLAVSYFTALGDDFLSSELLVKMDEEGIHTEYVLRSEDRHLGLYMVQTDVHGERTFTYWRQNSAATQSLNLLKGHKVEADVFYFSAISLAILDNEQKSKLFELIGELKAAGCKISFDPNYRPKLWSSKEEAQKWTDAAYAVSDLVFPGGDDHAELYGHMSTEAILEHLGQFKIDEVVVKNGASSVNILIDNKLDTVAIQPVDKVVDTTAAGDAFNGGYLAARLTGSSHTDSARYGAKVAATVISYPGAIIDKQALLNYVNPV